MSQQDSGGSGRGRTLATRMVGVMALERTVFSDIDGDEFAHFQAMQIVMLSAVAALFGVGGGSNGLGLFSIGQELALVAAAVIGIRWWLMTKILTQMGTQWFPDRADVVTSARASRVIGYAHTPLILALLMPIPIFGLIVWVLINAWSLAAMNIGIQQLLPGVPFSRYAWILAAAALPQFALLILV